MSFSEYALNGTGVPLLVLGSAPPGLPPNGRILLLVGVDPKPPPKAGFDALAPNSPPPVLLRPKAEVAVLFRPNADPALLLAPPNGDALVLVDPNSPPLPPLALLLAVVAPKADPVAPRPNALVVLDDPKALFVLALAPPKIPPPLALLLAPKGDVLVLLFVLVLAAPNGDVVVLPLDAPNPPKPEVDLVPNIRCQLVVFEKCTKGDEGF